MKLRRQPIIITAAAIFVIGIVVAIVSASKKDKVEAQAQKNIPTEMPMNISIMLDLSDRLITQGPNDNMPQMEKDTTIIGYVSRWFVNRQVQKKFMSGDIMHVFCYPNPNIPNISQLQDSLSVDLTLGSGKKLAAINRNKQTLIAMPDVWHRSVESIYSSALKTGPANGWPGSDVWGFFERSVKSQCVKSGYRNILIIMTDGYLWHKTTWMQTATGEYTGISPKTINQQKAITEIEANLNNLEVLFLEINPSKPTDFGKIKSLLTNWCNGMGIKHVDVICTDLPRNNNNSIIDFLEK